MPRRTKREIAESVRATAAAALSSAAAVVPPPPDVKGVVWARDLTVAPAEWIWEGWIPRASVTLLGGASHVGKSMLLSALVAHVTGGRPWCGPRVSVPHVALWMSVEETPRGKILPRLVSAGADTRLVGFPGYDAVGRIVSRVALPGDMEVLRRTITDAGARLVVMDPISSYLAAGMSRRDETQVRYLLEQLEQVAWETDCAIVMTLHDRKSKQGPAVDHFGGSAEWVQTTRTVLRCGYDPREHGRRLIAAHKAGHADTPPASRIYHRAAGADGMYLTLGEEVDISAENLGSEPSDAAERDALRDAEQFLREELATLDQWSKDMVSRAAECGISSATLRRARVNLGITTHHVGSGGRPRWMWRLPK